MKREDFQQIIKANLETGLKGSSVDMPQRNIEPKMARPAHFEVKSFCPFLAKTGRNQQIFTFFKFCHTLCIEDRALKLNPRVVHAHAFHIYKNKPFIFIESALVQF
jgi:hypothetical protein